MNGLLLALFDIRSVSMQAFLRWAATPTNNRLETRLCLAGISTAAITGLVLVLYWNVIFALAAEWWNDPDDSFGMLIPPLAFLLAWRSRHEILAVPAAADFRGLPLVAFGCFLYIFGEIGASVSLARLSLIPLLAGLCWSFWGLARFRKLVWPLMLLATMIPLPTLVYSQLSVPLQLFASALSARIAEALGVTVYLDGNIIHLAHISLGVEEACSGLRSLASLIVVALIVGLVQKERWPVKLFLLAMAIPIAIGVNIGRIVGTAVLADVDERFAMGFHHTFSGWLLFVMGLCIFVCFTHLLQRIQLHRRQRENRI